MSIELDRVYNEDNLATLDRMEDGLIDITITSPPYNVDLGNNKYNKFSYDRYCDAIGHNEYMANMENVFSKVYAKTKSGGRCCINIGDGKNGHIPTHSDYIQMMKGIGWIPMTLIIWEKNTCSARTAWGSFMSPSCPSLPRTFEYILVFSKDSLKLKEKRRSGHNKGRVREMEPRNMVDGMRKPKEGEPSGTVPDRTSQTPHEDVLLEGLHRIRPVRRFRNHGCCGEEIGKTIYH